MRYTEKGMEKKARRKHNFIYSMQLLLTVIIGLVVIASIFGLLFKTNQLNKSTTILKDNKEINYNVSEENKNKEITKSTNNNIFKDGEKIIFKPIHEYTNNYIVGPIKESAINNTNRIKQQKNNKPNKVIEIRSTNNKNPDIWEDCPPYKKQGYENPDTVILCKGDKTVILNSRK